jgi:hypothetical protein
MDTNEHECCSVRCPQRIRTLHWGPAQPRVRRTWGMVVAVLVPSTGPIRRLTRSLPLTRPPACPSVSLASPSLRCVKRLFPSRAVRRHEFGEQRTESADLRKQKLLKVERGATESVQRRRCCFMLAWGNAPGIRSHHKQALKARFNPACFEMLNRAFSAGRFVSRILGRCPRLKMNAAPLALKRNSAGRIYLPGAAFSTPRIVCGVTSRRQ